LIGGVFISIDMLFFSFKKLYYVCPINKYTMLSLEEIVTALQDRKLKEVSRKSGVGYITVWRIANRCSGNVEYKSVAKISDYIESRKT
jgi:hypothetical protein